MLTGKWVQFHAQQQRAAQTTEDHETSMGVDVGYGTGDGQGSAEEWRLGQRSQPQRVTTQTRVQLVALAPPVCLQDGREAQVSAEGAHFVCEKRSPTCLDMAPAALKLCPAPGKMSWQRGKGLCL